MLNESNESPTLQHDSLHGTSKQDSSFDLHDISVAMNRTRQLISNSREQPKRDRLKKITNDNKRLYQRIINICT